MLGQRQLQMNQVPHFGPKDECQVGKARLANRRISAANVTMDSPGDCVGEISCSYLTSIWGLSGNLF
uniref:Uncharacterized protein n=1 Tax=Romanomermis culicivorax TaxID=13658 RepID=A0A915L6X1_ROMCU